MDLHDLEPGDKVALISDTRWRGMYIVQMEVQRTTSSQIVTTDGSRYRKSDGREVGQGLYGNDPIVPWTTEHTRMLASQKHRQAIREKTQELVEAFARTSPPDPALIVALTADLSELAQSWADHQARP